MDLENFFSAYLTGLKTFKDQLNYLEINQVFEQFKNCQGIIFFSGIGKSALVAKKIAVTMTSLGTRAIFMPPIDAMHGDIGLLSEKDLFVIISKSGETEELLNLIPSIRHKKAPLIVITSNAKSQLAKLANYKICLSIEKELCAYNMAPTISTTAQLIVGDVLAIALMQAKNFSLNDYAINHPAGTIGKRITMKVADLMLKEKELPLCYPEDKLVDSLVELSDKKAGCLLIIDKAQKLKGIFTDGDLRRALQKWGVKILNQPMKNLMVKTKRTIFQETLAWHAMLEMERNKASPIMVLPVVTLDNQLIGLIKMHDILKCGL